MITNEKRNQLNSIFRKLLDDKSHKSTKLDIPRLPRLKIINIFGHIFYLKLFSGPIIAQTNVFNSQEHLSESKLARKVCSWKYNQGWSAKNCHFRFFDKIQHIRALQIVYIFMLQWIFSPKNVYLVSSWCRWITIQIKTNLVQYSESF